VQRRALQRAFRRSVAVDVDELAGALYAETVRETNDTAGG